MSSPMVPLLALLASTFVLAANASNVTCSGTGMNWYTNFVGESPCRTYERLRQICNPAFQVGVMRTNTPPDVCDEQLADCCCNSIAFALAMLCLNCQQNIGTSSGYDAGAGAYQLYLQGGHTTGTCSPVHNQTLSSSIHTAVCNEEIKIFDTLYTLFWNDGSWFYEYTTQTTSEYIATQNNNTFTRCPSTTLNQSSSASSSTAASAATSSSEDVSPSSSGLSGAAMGGIAAGVVTGAFAVILILWFLWWKKRVVQGNLRAHQIEPFASDKEDTLPGGISTPSNLYHYSAVSQVDFFPRGDGGEDPHPSGYNGYPTQISFSAYGDSSTGVPSDLPPSPHGSRLLSPSTEKGLLYSTQNPSMMTTTTTITGSASLSSPGGFSYDQSLGAVTETVERHRDGGRVPDGILDGSLPPAYGEQID